MLCFFGQFPFFMQHKLYLPKTQLLFQMAIKQLWLQTPTVVNIKKKKSDTMTKLQKQSGITPFTDSKKLMQPKCQPNYSFRKFSAHILANWIYHLKPDQTTLAVLLLQIKLNWNMEVIGHAISDDVLYTRVGIFTSSGTRMIYPAV